jgi:hypothetical protein
MAPETAATSGWRVAPDAHDSDFIVGLVGKDLFHPAAWCRAAQVCLTALYLERLGPFFVGRVAWQSTT